MDIPALQGELTDLSDRWSELEEQLTEKLSQFRNWLLSNFPKPPSADFYASHLPFQLYPAAMASTSSALLDLECPTDAENFRFQVRDRDGDMYLVRLPFAWIQDAERFKQTVLNEVAGEQAVLDARKPAKEAALKALSAARAEVYRLERELTSNV
jgi:hypothetical protein